MSNAKIDFINLKGQYQALKSDMDARIHAVLNHGQYILGPEVVEMEKSLAAYTGAKHCIACASGTDALLIALMAKGIGPGDEVITTPFTFVATAEVIALVGATPVYVDIEPDTYNMDISKVEAAVTAKTKAIIPVSLYGQVADMDELNALAGKYGFCVIEDACQSFGASYKGRKSCNVSEIGCTSFFPSKPLGCYGDGGAIFTNDDALALAMREIRVHGQSKRYYHTRIGIGGRMDTLQCAVILSKMTRFEQEVQERFKVGARYCELLSKSGGKIQLQAIRPDRDCVWAQFTIGVEKRDELSAKLQALGIPTAVHYPMCLHQQPAYLEISRSSGSMEHAERAAQRVISLPMYPDLDPETQDRIVNAVLSCV